MGQFGFAEPDRRLRERRRPAGAARRGAGRGNAGGVRNSVAGDDSVCVHRPAAR